MGEDDKQRGIRILLVTDKFAPEVGGACAVAEALAENLPDHVTVAAPKSILPPSSVSDWSQYDRRFSFPVHRVKAFTTKLPKLPPGKLRGALELAYNALWTQPRASASLRRLLNQSPADVVCINTLVCYWVPAMLKRRYPKLKVVFYLHGEEVSPGPRRRKTDDLAHRGLRNSDAVITVSSFTRDLAIGCGVDPKKITVINNGVDTARFTPGPKDAAIEQRFGLHGKKVLLCLGRMDERKGQDMLLRAMPEILAAVPQAVILLVGGGEEEVRLRALAQGLNLANSVIFAGVASDEEVVSYYRTADVFAMPNRTTDLGDTEGFGLVFLEAGACAKPVVGGLAGGVPDAIIEGETGFLVNGRSHHEVARACIRLLADSAEAARLGQNGLSNSKKNTWAEKARSVLKLCESLCDGR